MVALLIWSVMACVSPPKVLLNPAPTVETAAPPVSTARPDRLTRPLRPSSSPGRSQESSTVPQRFSWGILRLGCDLRFG